MSATPPKLPAASARKKASKSSASRAARPQAEARSQFVSHFTPGLMTPRVLEAIFVGRTALADRLMESVRSSATSDAKQQTLLIAPRGFGKSHLVALIYHRIQAEPDLADRLRVAWLREEEWGITSFLDVLLRVYRALNEQYPGELPTKEWNSLYDLDEAGAQAKAIDLLRELVGKRTLLVLLENADDVFAGLGDGGQKQWRAFLQENNFCSTLLTSPSLFNGVARRESPFFGFFRVLHLDPISLDEAVELLHRLAVLRGDQELADFLLSSVGRARVRAIHHLAGGNPRVYVIFAQFLTRQTLDELVEPFFKMLDDLTPYYQSRMKLISPQQRKIIEFLCDYRGAAAVKMVASRGFMAQQTASGQLLDLKDKGYVIPRPIGRETFYELREPLMRLCIEVKKNRGEPIGLLVDFLRLWYPLEQLQQQLVGMDKDKAHTLERIYLQHAIQLANEEDDPRVEACWADARRFSNEENFEASVQAYSDLVAIAPVAKAYLGRAACFGMLERFEESITDLSQAINLDASLVGAWELRAESYSVLRQFELALNDWNRAITLSQNADYLLRRAHVLSQLDRKDEAVEDVRQAFLSHRKQEERELNDQLSSAIWLQAATLLSECGQRDEAKAALRIATANKVDSWKFYRNVARLWRNLSEPKNAINALKSIDRIIEIAPSVLKARFSKSTIEIELRRYAQSRKTLAQAEQFIRENGNSQKNLKSVLALQVATELAFGDVKASLSLLQGSSLFDQPELDKDQPVSEEMMHSMYLHLPLLTWLWLLVPDDRWPVVCPKFVSYFGRGGRTSLQLVLTTLITLVVTDITPEKPQNAKASAWLEAWRAAVGKREELQLAIRLTETAIRYRQTLDERILLELPVEERTLLEEQLGQIEAVTSTPA